MAILWSTVLRRPLNDLVHNEISKPLCCILKSELFPANVSSPCFNWLNLFDIKRSYKQHGRVLSLSSSLDKIAKKEGISNRHPSVIGVQSLLPKSSWRLGSPHHKHPHQSQLVLGSAGHRWLSTSSHRHAAAGVESTIQAAGVAAAVTSSRPLWFPDFPTIQLAESFITMTHSMTGLQWWSTIVLTTAVCRLGLMMLPAIYRDINQKRLEQLDPELRGLGEKVRADVLRARKDYGWSEKKCETVYVTKMKQLTKERYLRENCHPMKSTAVFWFQLPLWLSVTFALRNMSTPAGNPLLDNHSSYVGYMSEGIAWIPDLTVPDPTFILPVMMSAVTLFNIEMMYLNMPKVTVGRKLLIYAMRVFSLGFIPLGSIQPSAMVLYWVTSALCASGQTLLLNYSPFRRRLKLPHSSAESDTPFRSLLAKAGTKYKRKSK